MDPALTKKRIYMPIEPAEADRGDLLLELEQPLVEVVMNPNPDRLEEFLDRHAEVLNDQSHLFSRVYWIAMRAARPNRRNPLSWIARPEHMMDRLIARHLITDEGISEVAREAFTYMVEQFGQPDLLRNMRDKDSVVVPTAQRLMERYGRFLTPDDRTEIRRIRQD